MSSDRKEKKLKERRDTAKRRGIEKRGQATEDE